MENQAKIGFAIYSPPLLFRGVVTQPGGYLPDDNGNLLICESEDDAAMTAAGAALMYGLPFAPVIWPPTGKTG